MAQVTEIPPREEERSPRQEQTAGSHPSPPRTMGFVLSLLTFGFARRLTPRTKRWIARATVMLCVLFCVAALGLWYTGHRMNIADAQHAAFRDCGTQIKSFLSAYAAALEHAVSKRDVVGLRDFYSHDYRSQDRGKWSFQQPEQLGGATLARLLPQEAGWSDRDVVLANWAEYLDGIEQIEHVQCKINLMEEVEPEVRVVVNVKYVLDGLDRDGQLFQDRFFLRWHVERNSAASTPLEWTIVEDELIEGVRVAGRGDSFARLDPTSIGVDYVHARDPKLNKNDPNVHLKFAVIEHAFGGVSAVDYDDDGRTDLFFADGVRSRLYRNVTPKGSTTVSFADVTNEAGLGVIDQAHTALFADVDNDGDKDLIVTRYLAAGGCKMYRNDGTGHFTDCSAEMGLDIVRPCVSACLLDYNLDGYLDIYIGVNGNPFVDAPDIPFYAVNGQPNILLKNVAGKRFVDVTEESGTGNVGWTLAVTAGDYNNDGLPDIAVANDFGRKVLFRNEGNGKFTDCTKAAGVLDFSGGMGVAFADLNGDDFPDLITSNIESGQRWFGEEITLWQYMRNISRSRWIFNDLPEYSELYGLLGDDWRNLGLQIGRGNSVFANNTNGTFEEWEDSNAKRAGWAWSCNAFDFDNDTDLDIYVANGWISGPNPSAPDL
ncbi:MAG TPA: VCBS repeat-containing protein [Pirellulaceae bacterium]|nr:VCBS repeat-containing protein [Pirellulaceae bacterium]